MLDNVELCTEQTTADGRTNIHFTAIVTAISSFCNMKYMESLSGFMITIAYDMHNFEMWGKQLISNKA